MDDADLRRHLGLEEGYERFPYKDTVGKLTIGIGHNLTDNGLTDPVIEMIYQIDAAQAEASLDHYLPWWRGLDAIRQVVLADMTFNIGINAVLEFKNTLASVQSGDFAAAAQGMRQSLWAKQVGSRAEKLAVMMETGEDA